MKSLRSMKLLRLTLLAVPFVFAAGAARSAEHTIYPPPQQARVDIAHALRTAATQHKRVLLDFGGNW